MCNSLRVGVQEQEWAVSYGGNQGRLNKGVSVSSANSDGSGLIKLRPEFRK